jgi:hypothetical protein
MYREMGMTAAPICVISGLNQLGDYVGRLAAQIEVTVQACGARAT